MSGRHSFLKRKRERSERVLTEAEILKPGPRESPVGRGFCLSAIRSGDISKDSPKAQSRFGRILHLPEQERGTGQMLVGAHNQSLNVLPFECDGHVSPLQSLQPGCGGFRTEPAKKLLPDTAVIVDTLYGQITISAIPRVRYR